MLRAPVMTSLRNGQQKLQRNIQKLSISKQRNHAITRRPAFHSVCGLATELSIQITIKEQKSNSDEVVFYKDDEDRFRQRWVLVLIWYVIDLNYGLPLIFVQGWFQPFSLCPAPYKECSTPNKKCSTPYKECSTLWIRIAKFCVTRA